MESGLEDRNNPCWPPPTQTRWKGLNGVRPRRPEQYDQALALRRRLVEVSMESGLEDRNNHMA